MHSVKKIRDLMGHAEIVDNKQTGDKPGNQIYHGTKTEGRRRVSARTRKGGSKPESQYNNKQNQT